MKRPISSKARKRRKFIATAPLHLRRKMMAAHLSRELREKYKKRSFVIREGDKVKIMRGQFKGLVGRVERVDYKRCRAYVEGAYLTKKDGSKVKYPIRPSNLMIVELKLDDERRKAALLRK